VSRFALSHGMVLAAGLGTRMRPLTLSIPKPLIKVRGRSLLDHALDELVAAGASSAVVNVHYLADQVEAHLARRDDLSIVISDERDQLLDTGGGVRKALHKLGTDDFAVLNADNLWITNGPQALQQLMPHWDAARMDALLLLAPRARAIGYTRAGDFEIDNDGRLTRRKGDVADQVYASIMIAHPRLFADMPEGPFSTNLSWDRAIAQGRLFGHVFDGLWCDVGTPQTLALIDALPDPS
jgi:N-acetyl-alpha-D-muramate 1-phosphate uridylyltransferase